MKKQVHRKLMCIILLVVILMLVFIRENIFVEINAIIDGHDYNQAYFYFFSERFSQMSIAKLLQLKWVLTLSFIGVVSGLSTLIIHLWFKKIQYTKIIFFFYVGTMLLLALLFTIFKGFGIYEESYFVLRKIIGLSHSPLPLFFSFAIFYYLEKISFSGKNK